MIEEWLREMAKQAFANDEDFERDEMWMDAEFRAFCARLVAAARSEKMRTVPAHLPADGDAVLKLAREWVDMLEGPHVIVPPPVIARSQIVDVARAYIGAVEQAELWQRRCEWLRDNAVFDSSWFSLDADGFLKRLDQHIAEELK